MGNTTTHEYADHLNAAKARYLNRFATPYDAKDFEDSVLSIGRELLPACALAVLDKEDGSGGADYYEFLLTQMMDEDLDDDGECYGCSNDTEPLEQYCRSCLDEHEASHE